MGIRAGRKYPILAWDTGRLWRFIDYKCQNALMKKKIPINMKFAWLMVLLRCFLNNDLMEDLNSLTVPLFTASPGRLFHSFTMRWEKKCFRTSSQLYCLKSLKLWLLVMVVFGWTNSSSVGRYFWIIYIISIFFKIKLISVDLFCCK